MLLRRENQNTLQPSEKKFLPDALLDRVIARDTTRPVSCMMDLNDGILCVTGWHRNNAGMRKYQAPEQKTEKTCYCRRNEHGVQLSDTTNLS